MRFTPFYEVAATENNPRWAELTARRGKLYSRTDDIRTEFFRDYNRILHSQAYGRLKQKTQVFFAPRNGHVCTRMEHVNHVASVSYSLCKQLGLNTELAMAIAIGHDLGHAPFGHHGETILADLMNEFSHDKFWHERNSLWFVDRIETLPGPDGKKYGLNLTYAVRDGIICHCGEVDTHAVFPREEYIELESMIKPAQYEPYTWEGCVVKIADKISFFGRDIEDAAELGIIDGDLYKKLVHLVKDALGEHIQVQDVTNTFLMHKFMIDLCKESNPDLGLTFSPESLELMHVLRTFSETYIYDHPRLKTFEKHAKGVLQLIFDRLLIMWDGDDTLRNVRGLHRYPLTSQFFGDWLEKYSSAAQEDGIYDITDQHQYKRVIIDYISGMTDDFAINSFNEIITF
ncbi:MAG: HD domain-containing protein [Firmicutes bacterium]|nr:HD domain-containing protein [Bacillota bacterium]